MEGRMRLAAAFILVAAAASAEPALVISGDGWSLPIEAADVSDYKTFPPPGRRGGLAFAITLGDGPTEVLARETTDKPEQVVTFADREGGVLLEGPLEAPIVNGLIALTFTDPQRALAMARRLRGFE
jgi:hypothetical protein